VNGMTSMSNDENPLVHDWVAHILAVVTLLTLLFALYISIFVLSKGESYILDPFLRVPMGLAVFWFFAWMAVDVIGGRRTSDRAGWLIFMALVPFISSLVYYFLVWRPARRNDPN